MENIMDNVQHTIPAQQFVIQKLYVKHVTFDIPSAELFKKNEQPKINFELEIKNNALPENNHYEVTLGLKAHGTIEEEKIFEITLHQAGIFLLDGYTTEQLEQLLNNHCPAILFPYAREVISDTAVRGGLMPIILSPINFDALYAQKNEHQKKQSEKNNSYADMSIQTLQ